jgi:hypothetical protein
MDQGALGPDIKGRAAATTNETWISSRNGALVRGLVGFWRLDDEAGSGTVADVSGHGLRGAVSGAVGGIPGKGGTAFDFDGKSANVSLGSPSALNRLTSSFTVVAWIKPGRLSGIQRIIGSGHKDGFSFGLDGGDLCFTSFGVKDYKVKGGLQAGVWVHVAAVMDASGSVEFFVNGASVGKVGGTRSAMPCTTGWFLGGIPPRNIEWFQGALDEVGIWRRPLSSLEIAALYALGDAGRGLGPELVETGDSLENGLVAHYLMEEGAGAEVLADASGNALDGLAKSGVTPGVAGMAGKGCEFTGSGSCVALGRPGVLNALTSALTVAAWVKPGRLSGWQPVVAGGFGFGLNGAGLRFSAFGVKDYDVPAHVPKGAWTHVAATLDASGTVAFFVNGERVGQIPGGRGLTACTTEWFLGGVPLRKDGAFQGLMDEVAVWNRVLTAAEMSRLYGRGRAGKGFCENRAMLAVEQVCPSVGDAGAGGAGHRKIWLSGLWRDSDGDGLTDYAEFAGGTKPDTADSDDDGLSDGQEIRAGTDPLNSDTDGDGLPDGWEVAHGFKPLDAADGAADPDGDGLSNGMEYAAGTDMNRPDTDGDGMKDGEEVRAGSNPAVADFGARTIYKEFALASFAKAFGEWIRSPDGCLVQMTPRSILEYTFTCAEDPGVLWVELAIRQRDMMDPQNFLPLQLYIDGMLVAQHEIMLRPDAFVTDRFVLPNLKAGTHTIRLLNDNAYIRHSPSFSTIRLVRYGAVEKTGQDWRRNRFEKMYRITSSSSVSKTSPFCLEGVGTYPEMMTVNGAASAKVSGNHFWYADVPLCKTGPTPVEVGFENGAFQRTATVAWEETNVLENGKMTIRRGDALLLAAHPSGGRSGTVSLEVDGKHWPLSGGNAEYRFESAGVHVVTATHTAADGAVTQGRLMVTVVAVDPPTKPLVLWTLRAGVFEWPGLPSEAVMDGRSFNRCEALGPGRFRLRRDEYVEQIPLVARLGSMGGPVLCSVPSYSIWLNELAEGYYTNFVITADGGYRYCVPLYLGGQIPPCGLRVKVYALADGVIVGTGPDSSKCIWIESSAFNILGVYNLILRTIPSRNDGPFHRVEIYCGSTFIDKRQ